MTIPEALEALGLPEGSDWNRVQAAYHRLAAQASERARAGDPNPGSARLEEAFQLLRRELLLRSGGPAPPPRLSFDPGTPRKRPMKSLLAPALLLAGVTALGWWTLTPKLQRFTTTVVLQPAPVPPGAAAVVPVQPSDVRPGAINYELLFLRDTAVLTTDGERILGRVADTMQYYPLDNINLVGYAYRGEPDPEVLAAQRAGAVSAILVKKYGLPPERVRVQDKVVDFPAAKVEIYIVEGAQ